MQHDGILMEHTVPSCSLGGAAKISRLSLAHGLMIPQLLVFSSGLKSPNSFPNGVLLL